MNLMAILVSLCSVELMRAVSRLQVGVPEMGQNKHWLLGGGYGICSVRFLWERVGPSERFDNF